MNYKQTEVCFVKTGAGALIQYENGGSDHD